MSKNLSLKTEILAGITTFLTMVYIAFINPAILQEAGMEEGAVFTATCLTSALGCALVGIMAKAPIALAPGMALNIYFSYSVVQGLSVPWQQALAMVFISGILFFIVSLTRLRKLLLEAIPYNLQIAILLGISLLIALIALQTNHIIVGGSHTLMNLGEINRPETLLFFAGFLIILSLDYFRVPGAIIIGIFSISALSLFLGYTSWQGVVGRPPSIEKTFLRLDFSGLIDPAAIKVTFTFFLIAMFDATGTLIGLFNQSVFKKDPNYPQYLHKSLTADAAASVAAGLLGCANTSPFIESAAGINVGGRSGLTALVVSAGFVLTLFFFPLVKAIPNFAVGPALLYVACCMLKSLSELRLDDITETAPCMLTMMMIPFTLSVADGIGSGIILYAFLKIVTRQRVESSILFLSALFILFFILS